MKLKTFLGKAYRWSKREALNRTQKVRYKTWLAFKQISFKNRDEKIKWVEKTLQENKEIYFTTELVKTGFTDQLIGFNCLYKMGKGLGIKYHHTPLSAHRSSDPFLFDPITQKEKKSTGNTQQEFKDIFDFLGVNEYLEQQSETIPDPHKEVYINLNVILFGREGIDSYETLIEEMKVVLYPFLSKNKKIVLCFFAEPRTYFHYYRYLHNQKEHEIDYYNCFKNLGGRWKSEFDTGSTNMLVHIRQGDTGTIETPWDTFIPVWHEIDGKFSQFEKEKEIPGNKRIYPEAFYKFVKTFQKAFAKDDLSTVVFSDGYKKTFRWIYLYAREKDVSLQEIEQLKELEPTYNELKFGKFNDLRNTRTVIGEEVDKLYGLVQSFFDTDIIVTGTQALLMPKFMSTYGEKGKMPFMILLYHTDRPHLNHVGFRDSDPFWMFVDINNYEISEIVEKVSSYLESRKKTEAQHL